MEDKNKELWEKCVAFHGHACGGLTIGYKAALYAMELLGLDFSKDEQAVCIAENDACGVDAVQVILGCSIGKGNLLFRLRGKQAFSFYNRETGASVRLVMRKGVKGGGGPDRLAYYQSLTPEELFEKKAGSSGTPGTGQIISKL